MGSDPHLFATNPDATMRLEKLGNRIPILYIDNVYQRPEAVREAALQLPFQTPRFPYPGRLAVLPGPNSSLIALQEKMLAVVNDHYLPRSPIRVNGSRIDAFKHVYTDFAIVDLHPDELSPVQQRPHTDQVAVFGLIYLNREERGGTLFFDRKTDAVPASPGGGYVEGDTSEFSLIGRIKPAFNRLAIYPGFVPHTGEIAGQWILGEERFTSPRLTQRLLFRLG